MSYSYVDVRQTLLSRMNWSDIIEITAFKRDLVTTDLICLELALPRQGVIVVHEEMDGWEALCVGLTARLAGMPAFDEWWHTIALPPLEPCVTILWRRESSMVSPSDQHSQL